MMVAITGPAAVPDCIRIWCGGPLVHRTRSFRGAQVLGEAWEHKGCMPDLAELAAFLGPHVADPFAWINERLPGALLQRLYKALDPDPAPDLESGWQVDGPMGPLQLMHRYHMGSMASRCQAATRNLRQPLYPKPNPNPRLFPIKLCPVCVSTGGLLP